MNSTTRSVFRVGVLTIGSLLGIGAGWAQAQTPAYYYPAPWCCYPAPVNSSPVPRYVSPAPIYSSPAPVNFYPARVSAPLRDNLKLGLSESTAWAGGATPY